MELELEPMLDATDADDDRFDKQPRLVRTMHIQAIAMCETNPRSGILSDLNLPLGLS